LITVVLCTYNGETYLKPMLDSLHAQTLPIDQMIVSDDGSTDNTLNMLDEHIVLKGPEQGFAQNFMSVFHTVDTPGDFIAFADQDDVWFENKLERAVKKLKQFPENIPALYGCRTEIIDAQGKHLGFSPLFSKKPSFANALVQNIAGGNTMVINRAAWNLIKACPLQSVVSHDWWFYLLVSAAGGHVYYDHEPAVYYRQHDNNLVGANNSWRARCHRIKMLMQNRFKHWNDINIANLKQHEHQLTHDNKIILANFIQSRESSLFGRIIYFYRSGVYRQTRLGMLGLCIACLLNKA
jgi:glycosyltransferase involved in cell wall biosynthesis